MDKNRVVITGLGVIASSAIGKKDFFAALLDGVSGIKPVSLFETAGFKTKLAGEVKDFSPQEILGPKGLRTLDRSTKLVVSAAKLALDDGGLRVSEENTSQVGVVVGNTFGSLHSICEFDKEGIKEGPYYVNPALFPNTVINSPASQVSIKFNIRGFNTTISTGPCASLDAINYAADFLKMGRAKFVLAAGVEELCLEAYMGFYKTGCLAGSSNGAPEISCPFDKRRNGVVLGEGSAVLILEDLNSALGRKAQIFAEVLGFGMSFDPQGNTQGAGIAKAMQLALNSAQLNTQGIDCVFAQANSHPQADLIETQAIKKVFGQHAKGIYVSAVKSMLGETFSASGVLSTAAAVACLDKQMIPPTINYSQKDEACDLNYVPNQAVSAKVSRVLINAFGSGGNSSSLIIAKFNG